MKNNGNVLYDSEEVSNILVDMVDDVDKYLQGRILSVSYLILLNIFSSFVHHLFIICYCFFVTEAADERCSDNIDVLSIVFLIYMQGNLLSNSLENTCEGVHFQLSCRSLGFCVFGLVTLLKMSSLTAIFPIFCPKLLEAYVTKHL